MHHTFSRQGRASLIGHCSPTAENHLHAEGQGTRWAPAAWVINTLITELMPEKADGIQFQDPYQTLLV
jgi:hypothetical protein